MIAHVNGLPVEELLVPLVLGAGAFGAGVRALISYRRGQRRRPGKPAQGNPCPVDTYWSQP